ncbi:MAG: hypothetical protein C0418_03400 [Coriobacteriaceae bacterium]|nr:hypothetical protein [Coriobacteriaceae bacterium]
MPGVISWAIVSAAVVGLFFFPDQWASVATVFVGYLMLRMILIVTFAIVGDVRRRIWEKRDWTEDDTLPGPAAFSPADVHHVVLVPNYKEPLDVLERTIGALAVQHRAEERVVVVLGMEQREPGALEKGEALAARYADRFESIIVTVHPADVPGELACKASNQTYAAGIARDIVVRELGIPLDRITVTSCDADSVIHPKYFAAVSRMFAADERRHARFWQAPMHYYNNIWDVPAPIRYTAWFIHAAHLAELAMPFYEPLPISTYTLSMKMAEETGWWDPMVISEDWHVMLNAMFKRHGDVSLTPVFLPTWSDATDGETFWRAMKNRYDQVLRHAWGAEDVGYILREIIDEGARPAAQSVFRLVQVLHDHTLRVASWFMLITGYAINLGVERAWAYYDAGGAIRDVHPVLRYFFLAGTLAVACTIVVELLRTLRLADGLSAVSPSRSGSCGSVRPSSGSSSAPCRRCTLRRS